MAISFTILPAYRIDKQTWNHCVLESSQGLIYSSTEYLDALSENWHGLVVNDYESVMPLPWKKKAGIRYCYTPPFIQQLGLTGNINQEILKEAIKCLSAFVSYGDFTFNFSNTGLREIIPVSERTNLIINLINPYNTTRSAYKQDVIENIRKAENENLLYKKEYAAESSVSLYQQLYKKKIPSVKPEDYTHFTALCKNLYGHQKCFTRSVMHKQELLCTAVLLIDNKRIYNIMNATTSTGRAKEANYFLFDQLIQEFSGTPLLLDFEGSDLPGVNNFYKKLGGSLQPYFQYHYNRLTWPLCLLKR